MADRVLRILSGETPREWSFEPRDATAISGAGLTEAGVAVAVRAVLEATGVGGLHVGDKPVLEGRLVAVATEVAA